LNILLSLAVAVVVEMMAVAAALAVI